MRGYWALLPLLALLLSTAGSPVAAQEGASISVDPPALSVGPADGPFEVLIMVDDVTAEAGLGSYVLAMSYDPAIISGVSIADTGFVGSTDNAVTCPQTVIDNDDGKLAQLCLTIPILPQPGPLTTEPQALARITFEPVGEGTTVLDISETSIIDTDGNTLPATNNNGEVTVGTGGPASAPEQDKGSDGGSNAGLYIGLGVGGAVGVAFLAGGLVLWRRRQGAGP